MATQQEHHLLDLFDSFWFSHQIFKNPQNPLPRIEKDEQSIHETNQSLDFSSVPTINVRSYSDQLSISQQSFVSDSPNSVLNLQTPKLQTIFSGKEAKETQQKDMQSPAKEKKKKVGRKRENNSKSKSLSELEFEEVKGFMDLGFVFSEKDKDSRLVSIIPGLQRLGKDEDEDEEEEVKKEGNGYGGASRPYLSEAWDDVENRKEEAARVVRIPAFGIDEMEIKHQLRVWAHSVASAVRCQNIKSTTTHRIHFLPFLFDKSCVEIMELSVVISLGSEDCKM